MSKQHLESWLIILKSTLKRTDDFGLLADIMNGCIVTLI